MGGSLLLDLLRYARYEPQVLQIELHPYLTQDAMVKLAKQLGIAITGYSSFGPQSYVELGIDKGHKSLMEQDCVVKAARAHNTSKPVYRKCCCGLECTGMAANNLEQARHKSCSDGPRRGGLR